MTNKVFSVIGLARLAGATLLLSPLMALGGGVSTDLSITKTDGADSSVPGEQVIYTIVAANNGPNDGFGTVTDVFEANLSDCDWTCSATAGSSCSAAGMGDINDMVSLLNGGAATYTATCNIELSAAGNLVNTATISTDISDPVPGNNSATDTNTLLAPRAVPTLGPLALSLLALTMLSLGALRSRRNRRG